MINVMVVRFLLGKFERDAADSDWRRLPSEAQTPLPFGLRGGFGPFVVCHRSCDFFRDAGPVPHSNMLRHPHRGEHVLRAMAARVPRSRLCSLWGWRDGDSIGLVAGSHDRQHEARRWRGGGGGKLLACIVSCKPCEASTKQVLLVNWKTHLTIGKTDTGYWQRVHG